jgi:ketosteroid isomerase-like protein
MKDRAKEELRALEHNWAQAFVRGDADAAGSYMADDWIVVTPEGNLIDKAAFLAMVRSGMLTHDAMELAEVRVRVFGDTAIVAAQATSKGRFNGAAFSELERSSDVFVKQQGDWKCVLTQLTRIAKA